MTQDDMEYIFKVSLIFGLVLTTTLIIIATIL